MSRLTTVLLLSIAMVAAGCDSPRSPLEPHDFEIAAKAFVSLAAEAEMLSQQLAEESVTGDFAAVHQEALGEESLKIAKDVAKPVPEKLRPAHQALAALNGRFQSAIMQVADAEGKPGELQRLQNEFREIGAHAAALKRSS